MAREDSTVLLDRSEDGEIWVVTINRPDVRNAADRPTADALVRTFLDFERDSTSKVAILCGSNQYFCAGADLKAVSSGFDSSPRINRIEDVDHSAFPFDANAPMGPSRLRLSKPVIAAVQGYAVAGGLELAAWCDLRVVEEDAVMGVFCRRWGVPLIDGGTVRLPRLIGQSAAMDLILTGRPVGAEEAQRMGLANRVVPSGTAVEEATRIARTLCKFPQKTMRGDRLSSLEQWELPLYNALQNELERGKESLADAVAGASKFSSGQGRHGSFSDFERRNGQKKISDKDVGQKAVATKAQSGETEAECLRSAGGSEVGSVGVSQNLSAEVSSSRIKAVLFDLGGVLFDSPFPAIAKYEESLGLPRHTINKLLVANGDKSTFARLERGELTVSEFVSPFEAECRAAGFHDISGHTLITAISSAMFPRPLWLEVVRELRDKGYKTAAITNNFLGDHQADAVITELIAPIMDRVIESARCGLRKPDPQIYNLALRQLALQPSQALMCDDIGNNLKGAKATGLQTLHVRADDRGGLKALKQLEQRLGIRLAAVARKVAGKGRL